MGVYCKSQSSLSKQLYRVHKDNRERASRYHREYHEDDPTLHLCSERYNGEMCGGRLIENYLKELACELCGLVYSGKHLITEHSEHIVATHKDRELKERTGNPVSELSTDISVYTVFEPKQAKDTHKFYRLKKKDQRVGSDKRNLMTASSEIRRIGKDIGLNKTQLKECYRKYNEARDLNLLRGRSIEGMVSACIFYQCRKDKKAVDLQTIVDKSRVGKKSIYYCLQSIVFHLKSDEKTKPLSAHDYVAMTVSALNLPYIVEDRVMRVIKFVESKTILTNGKDPRGFCGSAIYNVCQYLIHERKDLLSIDDLINAKKVTQKKIGQLLNITENTIRNRNKDLEKFNIKFKEDKIKTGDSKIKILKTPEITVNELESWNYIKEAKTYSQNPLNIVKVDVIKTPTPRQITYANRLFFRKEQPIPTRRMREKQNLQVSLIKR